MSEALKEIEKLVLDVAQKALEDDTPLQNKVEALKI